MIFAPLSGVFRPFKCNVLIDMVGFKPTILLFVFSLNHLLLPFFFSFFVLNVSYDSIVLPLWAYLLKLFSNIKSLFF